MENVCFSIFPPGSFGILDMNRWHFRSFCFFSFVSEVRLEKNWLTLVSLATDITIDVCLRGRTSLEETTAIVTEEKGTD